MVSIEDTLKLIARLHSGQTDKSGQPYVFHPIRVANNLLKLFPNIDEDAIHAALLHDTVEDCDINQEGLKELGYSERCLEIVELVTKPENDIRSYDQVITDLINNGNREAILVKIADNMDNLHPERIADFMRVNPERVEQLKLRYEDSIRRLSDAAGISSTDIFDLIANAATLERQNKNNLTYGN